MPDFPSWHNKFRKFFSFGVGVTSLSTFYPAKEQYILGSFF